MTIYCNIDPADNYMEFIYRDHWWSLSWNFCRYYWDRKQIFDYLNSYDTKEEWVRTLDLDGESEKEALRKAKHKIKRLTVEELEKVIPVEYLL